METQGLPSYLSSLLRNIKIHYESHIPDAQDTRKPKPPLVPLQLSSKALFPI